MKKSLVYLFNNFEKLVANLCLLSLVVLLGAQVLSRYVLQAGISWTEELSRFSFIWFVYISGSLAAQAGTHIRVTVIVDRLPPAWKNACRSIWAWSLTAAARCRATRSNLSNRPPVT